MVAHLGELWLSMARLGVWCSTASARRAPPRRLTLILLDSRMLSLQKWLDEGHQHPTGTLVRASLVLRAVTSLALVLLGSLLPSFETDAAALAHPIPWWVTPFVRWDSVHFVNIAVEAYKTEQQTAFMPGLPVLMRGGGKALHWLFRRRGAVRGDEVVLVGLLATTLATTAAALCLHRSVSRPLPRAAHLVAATLTLLSHSLTLVIFPYRPRHALLTALLFLFAPSRPTLHGVPYTEPFAALSTFGGMLLFAQGHDVCAAAAWAAGSAFRAQGALLGVGFFGWRWILRRSFDGRKSYSEVFKVRPTLSPSFELVLTLSPCSASSSTSLASPSCPSSRPRPSSPSSSTSTRSTARRRRPATLDHGASKVSDSATAGCSASTGALPLAFCFGRRLEASTDSARCTHRDVGPFHYWTLLQVPNFVLAAPVLVLSLSASWTFYSRNARAVLRSTLPFLPPSLLPAPAPPPSADAELALERPLTAPASPHLVEALVPHVHLHTATTLLLVVSAHVQIALRVCATGPVVWWYAAELVERGRGRGQGRGRAEEGEGEREGDGAAARAGRAWVRYVEVWGVVATALWAVFLPPA